MKRRRSALQLRAMFAAMAARQGLSVRQTEGISGVMSPQQIKDMAIAQHAERIKTQKLRVKYAKNPERKKKERDKLQEMQSRDVKDMRIQIGPGGGFVKEIKGVVTFNPSKENKGKIAKLFIKASKDYPERARDIYDPAWTEGIQKQRFRKCEEFGSKRLSQVRQWVLNNLGSPDRKTRQLATIVSIADKTGARIGNEDSADNRGNYGVTQWRAKHVRKSAIGGIDIVYRGKSYAAQDHRISDMETTKALWTFAKEARVRGGRNALIFDEVDDSSARKFIQSNWKINPKDFRTYKAIYTATTFLSKYLKKSGTPQNATVANKAVKECVDFTAKVLGNTSGVTKKRYIPSYIFKKFCEDHGFELKGKGWNVLSR